jgi:prepilin-type N-terminal cleavage/methylation domain-containing protein
MKLFSSKKGFTLIELVVVIAILGILAGIAIPRFLDATATARGAKIVADMRTIDSAIMVYNAKTGNMPSTTADLITDGSTATPATQFKLLAAWPVPPTGKASITKNDGSISTTTIATGASYGLNTGKDRATLSSTSQTVDEILTSGFTAASNP